MGVGGEVVPDRLQVAFGQAEGHPQAAFGGRQLSGGQYSRQHPDRWRGGAGPVVGDGVGQRAGGLGEVVGPGPAVDAGHGGEVVQFVHGQAAAGAAGDFPGGPDVDHGVDGVAEAEFDPAAELVAQCAVDV